MAIYSAVVGALGFVLAIGFLAKILRIEIDPREPPAIHPKIPLVGHIIGLLTAGSSYLQVLSERSKLPIFTLPMLTGRTYVVASPELAKAVQRASSDLDFDQLVIHYVPRFIGLDAKTSSVLSAPPEHDGRVGLLKSWEEIINPSLGPQKILETTTGHLKSLSGYVNRIEDGWETDLYHFATRAIGSATIDTFYGPNNPFALNPRLVESFWDYEGGLIAFVANVFPQVTARKAYQGWKACVEGFTEYTEAGRHSEAHPIVQNRKALHDSYGFSSREQAKLDLGLAFAFGTNAGITSFWLLNHIFSSHTLLAEIRTELTSHALTAPNTLSLRKLRDCPLLNSVYRETLRMVAPMTSARFVRSDTVLADRYLLRKGSVVQIAGNVMHSSPSIWGADATTFNARRFLHSTAGSKADADGDGGADPSKPSAVHPAAFRSFGGGASLCPGRHFAQMEILGFCAMLVLGFEMLPVRGESGVRWDPEMDCKALLLVVRKPQREVKVQMRRRSGFEGVEWAVVE